MVHARSRTLDYSKEELSKPVYDLQMLEGPQVKVRNQLQTNREIASPRSVKKNTMALGVFRSDKIAEAVGRAPSPSYLERS